MRMALPRAPTCLLTPSVLPTSLSRKILTITVGYTLIIRRRMLIEILRLLAELMLSTLTEVVLTARLAMPPTAAPDCQLKAVVIRRGRHILAPVIQTMMSDRTEERRVGEEGRCRWSTHQ